MFGTHETDCQVPSTDDVTADIIISIPRSERAIVVTRVASLPAPSRQSYITLNDDPFHLIPPLDHQIPPRKHFLHTPNKSLYSQEIAKMVGTGWNIDLSGKVGLMHSSPSRQNSRSTDMIYGVDYRRPSSSPVVTEVSDEPSPSRPLRPVLTS